MTWFFDSSNFHDDFLFYFIHVFLFYRTLEFMSRQQAHQQLLEKPPGTFLIRFSDGGLGAVTIAWCCEKHGQNQSFIF